MTHDGLAVVINAKMLRLFGVAFYALVTLYLVTANGLEVKRNTRQVLTRSNELSLCKVNRQGIGLHRGSSGRTRTKTEQFNCAFLP